MQLAQEDIALQLFAGFLDTHRDSRLLALGVEVRVYHKSRGFWRKTALYECQLDTADVTTDQCLDEAERRGERQHLAGLDALIHLGMRCINRVHPLKREPVTRRKVALRFTTAKITLESIIPVIEPVVLGKLTVALLIAAVRSEAVHI